MSTNETTNAPVKTAGWYGRLVSAINGFGEELGLDDQSTSRLREFVMATAKDQFKAGNKSGIRWARMNPPRSAASTTVAAAA